MQEMLLQCEKDEILFPIGRILSYGFISYFGEEYWNFFCFWKLEVDDHKIVLILPLSMTVIFVSPGVTLMKPFDHPGMGYSRCQKQ